MGIVPLIVPISDLRQDAAGVFERVVATDEPVFVTQRGRASVVIQSTQAYERVQHENAILRMFAQGDVDIAAGVGRDAEDVMAEARALLANEQG
jgi:prevent-host-death family protein